MICFACRQSRLQLVTSSSTARAARRGIALSAAPSRSLASTATSQSGRQPPATPAARRWPIRPLSPQLKTARYSSSTAPFSSSADDAPAATSAPALPPKPDFLDEAESHIWDLLVEAFSPAELSVRDISGGCGSMYGIEISAEGFRGRGMLQQQRMVNAALGDLVKDWHGLQLKTRVP